ncbi:MAG TPA: glycosyltransferase family 39 protein, partial [Campylobacterales bacterium]|nr:glycosyltransferase family 39 protein [Campylobacterales bacterium]
FLLAKRGYGRDVGIAATLIFSLSPAVTVGMSIMTPDAPLTLFWTMSLYYAYKVLFEESKASDFAILGILIGLSMASKYTAALLVIFIVIYVAVKKWRMLLDKRSWLIPLKSIAVFSPVVWWNYTHDWLGFGFQLSRAILKPNPLQGFGEFFGGLFAIFSPVFMGFLVYELFKWRSYDEKEKFFATITYGVLGFFIYKSFFGHMELNWAAPAFISGSVLVALRIRHYRKFFISGIAIAVILGLIIRFPFLFGLQGAANPHQRVFGYAEVAQRVKQLKTTNEAVMSDHLTNASILWFYIGAPVTIPTDSRMSAFDFWGLGANAPLKKGIYMSRSDESEALKRIYGSVELVEKFEAKKEGFKNVEFYIFRVAP